MSEVDAGEVRAEVDKFRASITTVRDEIGKAIVGNKEVVDGVLTCLLAGGHALLEGVPESALHEVYSKHLQLNPGVEQFVQACRNAGLKTLLVSGGFTFFSDRVRQSLSLDFARANVLEIDAGRLTGRLVDRPWGDIVDGIEKRRVLLEVCELMGIAPEQAIAVGDGANDLPMMGVAGLSIAYHPKPAVQAQAMVSILQGGMDRALELFDV